MVPRNKLPLILLSIVVALIVVIAGLSFLRNNSDNQTQAPGTQTKQASEEEPIEYITVSASGFEPASVTVKVGTRVIWNNTSGKTVTVNSDPHPAHTLYPVLQLGEFENGAIVETIFDKVGTFTYHNHFNPNQKGTITVQ